MVTIADLERQLSTLTGHVAWSVIAGPSTSSHFTIDFGPKRRLQIPMRNEKLREDQRLYEGEYSLFVECAWQLFGVNGSICGARDDNSVAGRMIAGLRRIERRTLTSVHVDPRSIHLELTFTDDLTLAVLPDLFDDAHGQNFDVRVADEHLILDGSGSLIRFNRGAQDRPDLRLV